MKKKDVIGCENMRFIGCKTNLLDEIDNVIKENCGTQNRVFCDIFAGTGAVSRYFKPKYQIISNDIMYFSHVITAATIENNQIPEFKHLKEEGITDPLSFLEITPIQANDEGYVAKTYSPAGEAGRMYFIEENANRIDFIRDTIERWKDRNWIDQSEYKYLLACLIEGVPFVSNITGTYGAYLKKWDRRAYKRFELQRLPVDNNNMHNICYNEDANELIRKISGDILYVDPPYNDRQYLPNYHVLETIAKNDHPQVSGITGVRNYANQKSRYCNKQQAYSAFEDLISNADFKHIIISYSDDGLLTVDEMTTLLKKYCMENTVKVYKISYNRYKGKIQSNNSEHFEYLFYARKKNDEPIITQPKTELPKAVNVTSAKRFIKSPMNYIGGKYKLLPQLFELFPKDIDTFIDLFAGSFTVTANINANKYICNDINYKVVELVRTFCYADIDIVLKRIHDKIDEYKLSKINADGFTAFRDFYNSNGNPIDLFTLSCFSFNYQFRFNNQLEYNNPFGRNRSQYSEVTEKNLILFMKQLKKKNIEFYSRDFRDLDISKYGKNDFIYCDPPYLITTGSYNDGHRGFGDWKDEEEHGLLEWLDKANANNIKFALSNVLVHNGKTNDILSEWAKKYIVHNIKSNYSNCNYQLKDKTTNDTVEVLITNY
jgi:adenine-specific DNA-methyltransferase